MSAEQELAALCDAAGLSMTVSQATHNPHMPDTEHGGTPMIHFDICINNKLVTPYSVGRGIPEAWAKDYKKSGRKGAPARRILNDRRLNPRCMLYEEGSDLAAKAYRPELVDVVGSLLHDADCLQYDLFEDWADGLGMDTDSIKAQAIWHACRRSSVAIRSLLGDRFERACELAGEL